MKIRCGIREVTIALLMVLVSSIAMAQPYWADKIGGLGNDHTADIQVDVDGSIYITGEFSGTIVQGGQSYTSAGGPDLFVARLTPAGDVTWFVHGGGTGADRGRALALGGDVLAITGEFIGTADIQGTQISSAGGSIDMFVAVLSKSTGSLVWVRHGGADPGTDIAHGAAISGDGRVSVSGEFRGTATWSGQSLTSMIDPDTNLPSNDVFIASYSSTGDLLWLKQGMAKYADKAMDIVPGPSGELYVTGQFSDTITFDQIHPNTLANVSFLLRLDADGNEVWFRRFGGAGYTHVYDLALGPDNKLKAIGDLQGDMVYAGITPVNIAPAFPFNYYVLSVDLNGELSGHVTVGSGAGVSGKALAVSVNTIAVIGEFNCRFDALSEHYDAPGIFMASGTVDLFITRHQAADLSIMDGQQFGGRSEKRASGIALLPDDAPVFCGSFRSNLLFASVPGFDAEISTLQETIVGVWGNYNCDDENYGTFSGIVSAGLTDGFVARGLVEDREPYDWWAHIGDACERVPLEPCIREAGQVICEDTLVACGSVTLEVRTNYSHSPSFGANFLGPAITYAWSNGSTGPTTVANSTGIYSVVLSSENGCWQWTDEIYVEIAELPPNPLISDESGVNDNSDPPLTITLCDGEAQWVWATNATEADDYWWTTPVPGEMIGSDSILIEAPGTYMFVMSNADGCSQVTSLMVIENAFVEMPDLDLDVIFNFYQDMDNNDSLTFCDGIVIQYQFDPVMMLNGSPIPYPDGLVVNWSYAPFPPLVSIPGGPISGTWDTFGSGWYTITLNFLVTNQPCGTDSLFFSASDSIHVTIVPTTITDVEIVGAGTICDGGTAVLVGNCSACQSFAWNGPGFTLLAPDTILITSPGTYSVAASLTNEFGCSFTEMAYFVVTSATGFTIEADPPDGIICPGTEASLFTNSLGIDHVWYGPNGAIMNAGDTLITEEAGEYSLSMDVGGCIMTSNSITLTNYATPYMVASPDGVLCGPGDQVTLQVFASGSATMAWDPPLSGSESSQVVDLPGTYSASVTSCGVPTTLTITIAEAPITAELLTPGPYSICPGDSVLLEGAPGAAIYVWLPSQTDLPTHWATTGGTYALIMQNVEGCADTALVEVTQVQFDLPMVVTGDTICLGEIAQLSAIGSGSITWYEDAGLTQVISTESSITLQPTSTVLIHVQQSEQGCTSPAEAVQIVVAEPPGEVMIEGPEIVCEGDELILEAIIPADVEITWNTPYGIVQGPLITIDPVTMDAAGSYEITPTLYGCPGSTAVHVLAVVIGDEIGLPGTINICSGDEILISIPAAFSDPVWSNGSTSYATVIVSGGELYVSALDPQGCAASGTIQVIEEDCALIIPNVLTPNGDGTNDSWMPEINAPGATARIYDRWGTIIYEGDILSKPWNGKLHNTGNTCSDGVYYYEISLQKADGTLDQLTGYIQLFN